jgi:hypothetical protein
MSRNLLEYPITKEEVIQVLEDTLEEIEMIGAVGGQEEHILTSLICVIEREFRHEDFNPYSKEDLIG